MKIYLAGPDIFRADAQDWIANARDICLQHGLDPLSPFDHGESDPKKILEGNLELIRKSQIVVGNLNPFRGSEPDSGTAFELGYALALGKKLWGYLDSKEPMLERIRRMERLPAGSTHDRGGMAIENFGLPLNLMLALSAHLVEGNLATCIAAIRPRTTPLAPPVAALATQE